MSSTLFSFAVIADTHTRPPEGDESSPWAVNALANARARYVVARVNQMRPVVTIHLGDIVHPVPALPTYRGAAEAAIDIMRALEHPYHYIPGNHDVGDKPFPANPAGRVNEAAIAAYEQHFGAPYSSFSHAGCRFILINSPVLNSGLRAEEEQAPWLEAELEAAAGERIFLFTHYPPYVCHRDEPSNYDNIDPPAREWLLALIERHRVEALFAGHVHNFFYHRHAETDCYLLPATSFFRQDYAELFRVEAADQHGRNDVGKLGFFTVDVLEDGHIAHVWRTQGQGLEPGESLPQRTLAPRALHPRVRARAPLGVHLRHPWAEITALPYNGPMDEFQRKQARNDHTLLTLWELGVRNLRVPLSDLLDERIRERMIALIDMGHRFTVFGFRMPDAASLDAMVAHADRVDSFEFVIPWEEAENTIAPLARLRERSQRPIALSKMESSAERKAQGSKFSHFVSYGFRPQDSALVHDFLALDGARDAVDSVVFRIPFDAPLWPQVQALEAFLQEERIGGIANVRLASENPAAINDDDAAIAMRVAEALCAAHCARSLTLFLDTYIDLDRGYFPRHGLFDRRFNPRPASFVYRHLQSLLGALHPAPTPLPGTPVDGPVHAAFESGEDRYRLLAHAAPECARALSGTRLISGASFAPGDVSASTDSAPAFGEPVLLRERPD